MFTVIEDRWNEMKCSNFRSDKLKSGCLVKKWLQWLNWMDHQFLVRWRLLGLIIIFSYYSAPKYLLCVWFLPVLPKQSNPLFFSAEVKLDPSKAWCPVLECQAVCSVQPSTEGQPTAVPCSTCHAVFCSGCRDLWKDGHTCPPRQPMMSPSASPESRSVSRPAPAATDSELHFGNDTVLKAGRVCCFRAVYRETHVTAIK